MRALSPQGTLTLELYFKHAPRACTNFVELVKRGYYNGTIFHRVIAVRSRGRRAVAARASRARALSQDFMAQCGDPTGTGESFVRCMRARVRGGLLVAMRAQDAAGIRFGGAPAPAARACRLTQCVAGFPNRERAVGRFPTRSREN